MMRIVLTTFKLLHIYNFLPLDRKLHNMKHLLNNFVLFLPHNVKLFQHIPSLFNNLVPCTTYCFHNFHSSISFDCIINGVDVWNKRSTPLNPNSLDLWQNRFDCKLILIRITFVSGRKINRNWYKNRTDILFDNFWDQIAFDWYWKLTFLFHHLAYLFEKNLILLVFSYLKWMSIAQNVHFYFLWIYQSKLIHCVFPLLYIFIARPVSLPFYWTRRLQIFIRDLLD